MPDSQETKVLKDINRHLADISEKGTATDTLTPSQTANMNRNVTDVLGNFTTLLDARLKRTVLVTDRAINEAFGNLKGFNADENAKLIGHQDDIISELKMNNRMMDRANDTQFLAEQEREKDLNINKQTNVLLEELVDKEDDNARDTEKSDSKFRGMMSGLLGGFGAGAGIKSLLMGAKGLAKKAFLPAVAAAAAFQFLRGWAEAGDDKTTMQKFNKGTAKMLSSFTFGLVSEKFFEDMLENVQAKIGAAWKSFTADWDAFVHGKMSGADLVANTISDLSGGALSAEQLKKIGNQVKKGLQDVVETITNAVIEGLVEPVIDGFKDRFGLLFDNPVEFFKQEFHRMKKERSAAITKEADRRKQLIADGMSVAEADVTALEERIADALPLGGVITAPVFGVARALGVVDATEKRQKEVVAEMIAQEERDKKQIKAAATRRQQNIFGAQVSRSQRELGLKREKKFAFDEIQNQALKEMVLELQRGLDKEKRMPGAQTLINNSPVISNTIQDTQTEQRITDLSALHNFNLTR